MAKIMIYDLKCNGLVQPLGIDTITPNFSWKIAAKENNIWQSAYQIVVYDESDTVVWNSGKIQSAKNTFITYKGKKLTKQTTYSWHVIVWITTGEISKSELAFFETAYLDSSDWRGEWIGRQIPEDKIPGPDLHEDPGIILINMMKGGEVRFQPDRKLEQLNEFTKRIEISSCKVIRKARIYITAYGIYELKVNEVKPDNSIFAPGFTKYDSYLEYQTYDITNLLKTGENIISVILADGWYKGKFGILGMGENYGDELSFLLDGEIWFSDGTVERFCSDESFTYRKTPWLYSDILIGSKYDAELEEQLSQELPVRKRSFGYENLVARMAEPVCPIQELDAKLLLSPKGEKILDFGQNVVGVVRMKVSGEVGTVIKLEHTEVLDRDGNFINCVDGFNRDQTDYYILKGEKEEVFEPKFTFHGFRYVKVTGYPGEINPANFKAIVIGSDLEITGSFSTSNKKLNQLQSNIQWGQRGNLLSIPTDCPQRERAGWTGDVWVYGETCNYNQDCYNFFRRWLTNLRKEQFENGLVPIVIPYIKAYKAIQLQSFGTHTSAGWGDVIISLPWVLYQVYGDKQILEENYESMEKWMAYVKKEAETGIHLKEGADKKAITRQKYLWNTKFHYGDWLYPSCKNESGETDMFQSANTTKECVATAIYANSTSIMSKVCEVLGKEKQAESYRELNRNIRIAFDEEYVSKEGKINHDLQGLYVMALAMDMVSEEKKSKVVKRLAELIAENHGCLDTGFMSIKFLMDVLCDNGLLKEANTILYQEKCPSWLYEVNWGATTIWETWNSIQPDGERLRFSYNHYAFGCVGNFLYRKILGIQAMEPGYKKVLIKPDFRFGLEHCEGTYKSVYGPISVYWKITGKKAEVHIDTPANVTAYLKLPGQSIKEIGNGTYTSEADLEFFTNS